MTKKESNGNGRNGKLLRWSGIVVGLAIFAYSVVLTYGEMKAVVANNCVVLVELNKKVNTNSVVAGGRIDKNTQDINVCSKNLAEQRVMLQYIKEGIDELKKDNH